MDYLDELIFEYDRLQQLEDLFGLDDYTRIRMKNLDARIKNLQKVRHDEVKYNIITTI